jgi:hypothetical protein
VRNNVNAFSFRQNVKTESKQYEKSFQSFVERRRKENIFRFIFFTLLCGMTTQKSTDFYWACRNGDVDTVKKILPNLKLNDINRIESNGSTALHAASYYGHANIVRLLLERGANTTIRNKYEKTAKEEASTDKVRALFESTVEVEEADDDDDDIPQSESVQLYPNAEGMDKSELATRMLKARLITYNTNKYSISAKSNLEHLEKKYRKLCEAQGKQHELHKGEEYFKKYRETGDFTHMIIFYTNDTPFYRMIEDDEAFLAEIYKHLLLYKQFTFRGRTYLGLHLLPTDFELFRWAFGHSRCLLEMRRVTLTSMYHHTVLSYVRELSKERRPVLLEIDFDEECFTAIDLKSFNIFQNERDVLILSATFFEVTQIRDNEDLTIVSLKHVPVNENVLSAVI